MSLQLTIAVFQELSDLLAILALIKHKLEFILSWDLSMLSSIDRSIADFGWRE